MSGQFPSETEAQNRWERIKDTSGKCGRQNDHTDHGHILNNDIQINTIPDWSYWLIEAAERALKNKPHLTKSARDFAVQEGVEILAKGNQYEYHLQANGHDMLLFRTAATLNGLENGRKHLDALVKEKIRQLEHSQSFKVSFGRTGEVVTKQQVRQPDGSYKDGQNVIARQPKLGELYGVEAALNRSQPSNYDNIDNDMRKRTDMKVYFLQNDYYTDERPLAYESNDKDNRASVFVCPARTIHMTPTEKDRETKDASKKWYGDDSLDDTVESLMTHEFAHNHQSHIKWDDPATMEKFASRMGWISYVDPNDGETKWMLKSSEKDAHGHNRLYKRIASNNTWVECNGNGWALIKTDAKGQKHRNVFSADEMRKKALYTPPTWYFFNPTEEYAECMMVYRLGGQHRSNLLNLSPELYDLVKEKDQEEIDSYWHRRYVRTPDGYLAEATPHALNVIYNFEQEAKTKQRPIKQK